MLDVGDPVAHGLVDRVLEGAAAGRDRDDLGAEQLHPRDVERLADGVLLAHVDGALEAEQRGGRRGGDAVLAGAGLGDHPGLAHPHGEQRLAEDVVDLVRAGVVEVLALEQDARAAAVRGEAGRVGERARAAGVGPLQPVELGEELGVDDGRAERGVELVERGDERLGDEAAAELAEVTGRVRAVQVGLGVGPLPLSVVVMSPGPPVSRVRSSPRGGHRRSRGRATAVRGSPPVTRLSPTSTASAPAFA